MSNQEAQEAREYFASDEPDEMIEEIAKPVGEDRPIAQIDTGIEPGGRKTHVWYMSTKFQYAVIFLGLCFLGWISHGIIFGNKRPKIVVSGEAQQVADLKKRLAYYENSANDQTRENASLTQGAQFDAIPMEGQDPRAKATPVSNIQQTTPTPSTRTTPARPQQRPVSPRNTVSVPPTRRYSPPPRVTRPNYAPRPTRPRVATLPSKPQGPSLDQCAEFLQQGLSVPACAKHRISLKAKPQSQPITRGQAPKPVKTRPITPVKLAPYKRPTTTAYAPKPTKAKPSYQVNYMAGEIQTVDQFEAEFYGSGQKTAAPKLSRMTAKVLDRVEWVSPQEAQQIIIPLQITSGSLKGQSAEAKIVKLNGVQFTAELTSLNGQAVEPGQYELRRKNTKYLRAEVKRQGGSNFGNRLLGTVASIGGEIASDQLANVRGGNHVSNLIPRSGQQRQQVTQYWKFDGEVEIVSKQ